jgi:hypothetical protein
MHIHLHTILIKGISTIFTDQMLTYFVFKKAQSMLASEMLTVYPITSQIINKKAQFKVALRRYLHTPFSL